MTERFYSTTQIVVDKKMTDYLPFFIQHALSGIAQCTVGDIDTVQPNGYFLTDEALREYRAQSMSIPSDIKVIDRVEYVRLLHASMNAQYGYCNYMLWHSFRAIFGKTPNEMFCAGIVSAHGDKTSGYWCGSIENTGMDFYQMTLVYLLVRVKLKDEFFRGTHSEQVQRLIEFWRENKKVLTNIEKQTAIDYMWRRHPSNQSRFRAR